MLSLFFLVLSGLPSLLGGLAATAPFPCFPHLPSVSLPLFPAPPLHGFLALFLFCFDLAIVSSLFVESFEFFSCDPSMSAQRKMCL